MPQSLAKILIHLIYSIERHEIPYDERRVGELIFKLN